jgi:hypothetical protein
MYPLPTSPSSTSTSISIMSSITDENTNTLNTRTKPNMTISTYDSMGQRQQHKVNCRTRSGSPIRPESRRRIKSSSSSKNNIKSKSNNKSNNKLAALALELTRELEHGNDEEGDVEGDEAEHCQQRVQSCVSFGGPVVSDEEEDDYDNEVEDVQDEVECSLMDTDISSMQVEVLEQGVVVTCDDDIDDSDDIDDDDMQVEEQDNHDVCNVINLLSFNTATATKTDADTDTRIHRTVSFGSVFTREYSVTVGDHPCSTDSAGLTLDWGFAPEYAVPVEREDYYLVMPEFSWSSSSSSSKSNSPRRRVRRMSASERRKRICSVTGCLPSDVRAAEYNMALQRYNQELTEVMHSRYQYQNRQDDNAVAAEEQADPQDAANESRRLLHHQQHLEVLYASFQDVQYQQEQEYSNYVHRHRQQQGHRQQQQQQHQQRQQERRQLRQSRSSKRAAPAPVV